MMRFQQWQRFLACSPNRMNTWMSIPFLLLILVGCSNDATEKTSNFEHDHFVAPHWPNNLADAATKIRERMSWLEEGTVPDLHHDDHDHHEDAHKHDHHEDHHDAHEHDHHDAHGHDDHDDYVINPKAEIIEIVSWIPEIAADTNLAEADWLPLYNATESLAANLRSANSQSADAELSSDNRRQLESLCQLVDKAVAKIPAQLPHLMQGQ